MKFWKIASAATALVLSTNLATASVVYQYTGNTYTVLYTGSHYNTSMSLSGFIELDIANPLVGSGTGFYQFESHNVIDFSFSDGAHTVTKADDPSFFSVSLDVDEFGTVENWDLQITKAWPEPTEVGDVRYDIRSISDSFNGGYGVDQNSYSVCTSTQLLYGSIVCGNNINDTAETSNLGSWAVVSAVPIPAAVWLFGSGLIGLAGFARRKKA